MTLSQSGINFMSGHDDPLSVNLIAITGNLAPKDSGRESHVGDFRTHIWLKLRSLTSMEDYKRYVDGLFLVLSVRLLKSYLFDAVIGIKTPQRGCQLDSVSV